MTTMNDFDRRLAAFLDEGPTRAPERIVEGAVAYAGAHRRRRDPFVALRRDPMAPRRPGLRPALVFAVVALALAISAAVYIGSQRPDRSLVPLPSGPIATDVAPSTPPSPSASPTASPTSSSTASPTPVATPGSFTAELVDSNGLTATVEVTDESGLLTAVSGFEADANRPQNAEIEVIPLPADEGAGERILVVMWTELSCPGPHRLTIDETARQFVLEPEACEADAIGVDHQLVLDFSQPVPADEVEAEIRRDS